MKQLRRVFLKLSRLFTNSREEAELAREIAAHLALLEDDYRRQGMLDDLRGAKAQDFDHRYIVQQIAAHREADILMRGYAKSGDNRAVKEFAATTDRAVKMHLSMAEKLDKKMDKTASR